MKINPRNNTIVTNLPGLHNLSLTKRVKYITTHNNDIVHLIYLHIICNTVANI